MDKIKLSIIIPTYNEVENLPILLEKLNNLLKDLSHEIIVVDDNSPDRTWQVAQSLNKKNNNLHVIRRMNDKGLGSAVVTGMATSRGEYLLVMDADLQHDENIIPEMLAALDTGVLDLNKKNIKYDIAIGSRLVGVGGYGEFSFIRKLMSKVATFITQILIRLPVKDPMSGFFIITRKLYEEKIEKINPLGFKILMEFLGHSPEANILEIPYTFKNRIHGQTKLSAGVVRHFFMALWNLRFGRIVSSTFVLYALIGFIGMFINQIGFGVGEFIKLPHVYTGFFESLDPIWMAVPFGIELSIISNYFLNNYITFYENRRIGVINNIKGFLNFQTISLLGVIIQWSMFQVMLTHNFFGVTVKDFAYAKYLYNFIGIMAATASNYLLNVNYTWKKV